MADESLRARQLPMVVPPDRTGSASRKPRTAPPHPLATRKRGVERRAGAGDRHVNGPERARAQTVRPWPSAARVSMQDASSCVFDPPEPLCAPSHATPPTPLPTPDHSLPTGTGGHSTHRPPMAVHRACAGAGRLSMCLRPAWTTIWPIHATPPTPLPTPAHTSVRAGRRQMESRPASTNARRTAMGGGVCAQTPPQAGGGGSAVPHPPLVGS